MSSHVKMTLTPCVGKVRRLEGRGQGQADLPEAKPQWNAEARNSPPLESKELWTLSCLQDMAGCPGVVEEWTRAQKQGGFSSWGPTPGPYLSLGDWLTSPVQKEGSGAWLPAAGAPPSTLSLPGPCTPAVSQIWSSTGSPFTCRVTLNRSNTVGV